MDSMSSSVFGGSSTSNSLSRLT